MTNPFLKYTEAEAARDCNLEVLSNSFVPESFPHREDQLDQMVKTLSSISRNSRPSNLLLYGKSGTGKTSVAKKVSSLLVEAYGSVRVIYINCQINDTAYSILVAAANELTPPDKPKIPVSGWTLDRIYAELLSNVDRSGSYVVVILDEIDKLVQKNGGDSLYVILKLSDDAEHARTSIIGITNYTSFLEELDARVRSRLNQESVVFPSYNASELRDILMERLVAGRAGHLVDDSGLSLCAAIGAREHGDARKAIDLMRIAIEIGLREGKSQVTETEVYRARDKYEMNILRESINGLPMHSKIILLSAVVTQDQSKSPMITGEIYENYKRICEELNIVSLSLRRASDLISDLDDLGLIISTTRSLGRYGRTRLIKVPDQGGSMKKYLLEDENLSTFKEIKFAKQHRLKMDLDDLMTQPGDKSDSIEDLFSSYPEDEYDEKEDKN